jgi:hypothetical protein
VAAPVENAAVEMKDDDGLPRRLPHRLHAGAIRLYGIRRQRLMH